MTEQTIPADLTREDEQAVREWAERILTMWDSDNPAAKAAHIVLAALPKPPTLADMTDEERAECQWMQCDAGPYGRRGLIVKVKYWSVYVVDKETGTYSDYTPDLVTACPDLPRMEWNGTDQRPAPAPALPDGWRLADHQKHGRVIVTNPTPNSDGRVYYVLPSDGIIGNACDLCSPSELTYIDQEDDTPTGSNSLAVGTVIESADDPRIDELPVGSILLDREGEATTKRIASWTGIGYAPVPSEGDEFGPWTVLHIPKEEIS